MSKIKTILVSQPKPNSEKSPYNRLKEKHNLKIDFRPFIHVEGLKSRDVRKQKIDFNVFNSIIFESTDVERLVCQNWTELLGLVLATHDPRLILRSQRPKNIAIVPRTRKELTTPNPDVLVTVPEDGSLSSDSDLAPTILGTKFLAESLPL